MGSGPWRFKSSRPHLPRSARGRPRAQVGSEIDSGDSAASSVAASRAYTSAIASKSAGVRPASRLRRGDLAHLADVAARLRRRDGEQACGPVDLARERVVQVVQHLGEHAVRVRGDERVGEQSRVALVDRGSAHLHCRREADLGADDAQIEPRPARLGELRRAGAGEVDARPIVGARRPAGDRAVDELEARRPRGRERSRGLSPARPRSSPQTSGRRAGPARGARRARPRSRAPGRAGRSKERGRPRDDIVEVGSSSSPAASASPCVRSLRPARVVTTRRPAAR